MSDTAAALLALARSRQEFYSRRPCVDEQRHGVRDIEISRLECLEISDLFGRLAAFLAQPTPEAIAVLVEELKEEATSIIAGPSEEVVSHVTWKAADMLSRLASAGQDAEAQGYERGVRDCVVVAETEEEMDGPCPPHILATLQADPVEGARGTCRATKKNIVKRCRALLLRAKTTKEPR